MRIFLATKNEHKVSEFQDALKGCEIYSSQGYNYEAIENAPDFEGNALIKARALADLVSCEDAVLADDSGLCVDALNGAPGVFSARFAGENSTDEDNRLMLAAKLKELNLERSNAQFVCVLALIYKGCEYVFKGVCDGYVSRQIKGANGFGYDAMFYAPNSSLSFAELSLAQKQALSHRGKAILELKKFLASYER